MSDDFNFPPDDDIPEAPERPQRTPPSAPQPPPPPTRPPAPRRRLPDDDLPPAYDRPSSRRPRVAPRNSQPVTPPVTPPPYDEPVAAPRSAKPKREPKRERTPEYVPVRQPKDKRGSGWYLPWWSLVIMLAFVGCAAVGALLVAQSIGGSTAVGGLTPVVVVITSTFTVGPPATTTSIPLPSTLTPTPPLPTIAPTASLPAGNFAIGETVKVVGVGLNGLNVRTAPGTDSTVKFRASDEDHFVLKDGPEDASEDEWWMIADSSDSTRTGWASRRFLTVIAGAPEGTAAQ